MMVNQNQIVKPSESSRHPWFRVTLLIMVCLTIFAGCSTPKSRIVEGKINVITSFYPLYDFASQIGGDLVHVMNLVPMGVDPHEWAPKTREFKELAEADLFIYNGFGFESWIHELTNRLGPDSTLVSVVASEGIMPISGENGEKSFHIHHEHDANHNHDTANHHDHGQYNPHTWLSPLQAMKIADNIKEAFIRIDPEHESDYVANHAKLHAQLEELHQQYEAVASQAAKKEFIVSHQAFSYLARDYGLHQVAIMGLSPHAEPTPQHLKRLIEFIKERDIHYILVEELVSPKLAETLAKEANVETLVIHPIEGLTDEQIQRGENYITLMQKNLSSLQKALSIP